LNVPELLRVDAERNRDEFIVVTRNRRALAALVRSLVVARWHGLQRPVTYRLVLVRHRSQYLLVMAHLFP
jgi:hypothetical protein